MKNTTSEIAPAWDHVPSFFVFNNQLSNSRKALPVWVAKRPEFTGFLQKCVDFNGGLSGDVCEALLEAKAFIRHAVKHVIAIAHAQEPTSTGEKTYRLIKAYRLAHNRDHTQYKKLASCYHDLYSFYDDDGGIWNMQALHDHLEALIRQDGEDKLHHIVQSASQPQTKQNRSAALVKWLRLWGAKNKRYMLSAISDSNGRVVYEIGECAQLLQSHWEPVFTRQGIDAQAAATFLRKYHSNAEPADLDWIINFDDLTVSFLHALTVRQDPMVFRMFCGRLHLSAFVKHCIICMSTCCKVELFLMVSTMHIYSSWRNA